MCIRDRGYTKNSAFERFTGRINSKFTPSKWFEAGINLSANVSNRQFNDNASGNACLLYTS